MAVRNCPLAAAAVAAPVVATAIATLVAGAIVGAAPAHAAPPGTLEVGGRAGLVVSALSGEAIDASPTRTSAKAGPTAGFLVRWRHRAWSIEGELGMSDRGARLADGALTAPVALHLYYVDLPLLGAYELALGGPVRPRALAGLMFSVLAAGTDPSDGAAPVVVDERFDLALVVGAGAAWTTSAGTLLLDLRLLGGARALASDPLTGESAARGQAVSFSVGFAY